MNNHENNKENNQENIMYYVDDDETQNNQLDIDELLKEFDKMDLSLQNDTTTTNNDVIFAQMSDYDLNYTVKQLTTICEYYGIKINKMKKIDMIHSIIDFENNFENSEMLMKRQQMWHYINMLKEDKFMKKYILNF